MPVTLYGEPLTLHGEPLTMGEPPMSIPDVETFHPRSVWVEPCFPVTGRAQIPSSITQPVAHYSAAANTPDGDIGEFDYQIIGWLRSVNRDYWLNRKNATTTTICGRVLPGYSIGYLFAIDWLGGVWELRGFDYMPAANADHNHYTAPLLFITDGASEPTAYAWASARAVWREFRRRANRADFVNRPLGHGELFISTGTGTPTACPGAGVLIGLHTGLGDLDYDTFEEDDMTPEIPPRRLIDTRQLGGKVQPGQIVEVGVPGGKAAGVNITVTESDGPGFVSAWGAGGQPGTSNVNYDHAQQTIANYATVPIDGDRIRFTIGGAPAHVIVDLQGVHA